MSHTTIAGPRQSDPTMQHEKKKSDKKQAITIFKDLSLDDARLLFTCYCLNLELNDPNNDLDKSTTTPKHNAAKQADIPYIFQGEFKPLG